MHIQRAWAARREDPPQSHAGGGRTSAEACSQYNLKPQLVSRWKAGFLEKLVSVFQGNEHNNEEQARIADLERTVRRLTLQRIRGSGLTRSRKMLVFT